MASFHSQPTRGHPLTCVHYTVDGSDFVKGYDAKRLEALDRNEGRLRPVRYESVIAHLPTPSVLTEDNAYPLLSLKGCHWEYEQEWRLILELSETIGSVSRDRYDQSINPVRVSKSAVKSLYIT